MRTIAVTAVLAAATAVAAPADAQVGVAVGELCDYYAQQDSTQQDMVAAVFGGPLAATAPGATISMTCTIQVGEANATHDGADACTASSEPSLQVTVLSPTFCSFPLPGAFEPTYTCTEATVDGVTYYWHVTVDPVTGVQQGTWSTSSSSNCTPVIITLVDPVVCPIIAGFGPGVPGLVEIDDTGDVFVPFAGIFVKDCWPEG